MTPPVALVNLLKPWADFYGDSKAAETIITFLHIGGLLLAGGLAIAADRGTIRALRHEAAERGGHLAELNAVHRWVVPGLGVVLLSGVALLTADIEAFWGSWIYWVKMGDLLGEDGARRRAADQRLSHEPRRAGVGERCERDVSALARVATHGTHQSRSLVHDGGARRRARQLLLISG
jgi:hypothetical protein